MPSHPSWEEERKMYCGNCWKELSVEIEDDWIKLIECEYHGINVSPISYVPYANEK